MKNEEKRILKRERCREEVEKVYIKFLLKVKRLVENFFTGCLSWDDGYLMCTNH